MLNGFPTNLGDEANILMSDLIISTYDTEECTSCPQLRSCTYNDSDEDEHDDTVAEISMEDEESTRIMSELRSPRGDNHDMPQNTCLQT